jgi:hypothetical protein
MTASTLVFLIAAGLTFVVAHSIRASWTLFAFVMPGTIAHELAHYLTAILTLSHPAPISLLPERMGQSWVLGSVVFKAGWFSGGVVALAPLYLLPLCAWWLYDLGADSSLGTAAGCGYLAALCLQGAWPSPQDWRVAFTHPIGVLLIGAGVYASLGP